MLYAPSTTSPDVDADELADLLARRRKLDEAALAEMIRRIKPVVRGGHKKYVVNTDDPNMSHLVWPLPADEDEISGLDKRERCEIVTLHPLRGECYRMFCPTPADVFAMMSSDEVSRARYFETIEPETEDDLGRQMTAIRAGFHAATTIIYF